MIALCFVGVLVMLAVASFASVTIIYVRCFENLALFNEKVSSFAFVVSKVVEIASLRVVLFAFYS